MTNPIAIEFVEPQLDTLGAEEERIVVFAGSDGKLDIAARKVNSLTRKALSRLVESDRFEGMKSGEVAEIAYPFGMETESVLVVKLERNASATEARKAGGAIARSLGRKGALVLGATLKNVADVAYGMALRTYAYEDQKTGEKKAAANVRVAVKDVNAASEAFAPMAGVTDGVFFTRDLVNAPANILTTTTFAEKLQELSALGVEVEVLEEDKLHELGMRTLLAVGQGSASPSKVVVMKWNGGGDEAPFALVGKGVVFDTGGISLKPAAGMEDMTMDMGGAGVVSGVMKAIATRGAKANVVGLVGLVENMPGSNATRPGDVVASMKGDTVEIINTDAEGRLVLADVMWYAQDRFKPTAMINLATLTGAIIIALGSENAGVFSNNDELADDFLAAAKVEDEGAWRMPLGDGYDALLKSNIADMKNIGGREGGSITAAQFLQRFVKPDTPWIHLDIAGVASKKAEGPLHPKGATGWGVRALDRLIRDRFEG